MELKNCIPVLLVKNAPCSKDFYVDVLGLTVVADFGGLNYVFKENFALWQLMEENIIPQTLGMSNIINRDQTSRFELCFETDNIDEVYKQLKKRDVEFLHEMNEELWGQRTLRFYDPDRHLLEVGEAMHIFLRRIYKEENGNIEAVAQRTFMQPEHVRQVLEL